MEIAQTSRINLRTVAVLLALAVAFQVVIATSPSIPATGVVVTGDADAGLMV
ncbi:MAG: hypothetical protein AB7Q81_25010 [Gammaproteobacteria bacterium]